MPITFATGVPGVKVAGVEDAEPRAGRPLRTIRGVRDLAGETRAALAALLPPRDPDARVGVLGAGSDDVDSSRRYLASLADGGWAVPAWPRELGGRGVTAEEATVIAGVLREFAAPDLYPVLVGLLLVGPTLLEHGTTEQQRRFLPRIASGEEIWCQLFSEPEAGSDLANAATRATRDGDEWVLDGQKVWTSRGHYAEWGILLARTDPEAPKHAGLTMFAVRMAAPGLDVRPLVQMNGDRHFDEVFLTGVRVPDGDRIGEVGGGWRVAVTVLAHERAAARPGTAVGSEGAGAEVPRWLTDLAAAGRLDDPHLRQRAMRVLALEQVTRLAAERAAASARAGSGPGPIGSTRKLAGAALFKLRAELGKDACGASGMLADSPNHVEFLTAPSMSIRGGTDEIQRNIVGERVLGLPPEPRVDKDIPWSRSRRGFG